MATIIGFGGSDASEGTARAVDVLEGKTFSNATDVGIAGSMKNHSDHTEYVSADSTSDGSLHVRIDPGAYVQKSPQTGYPVITMPLSKLGDVTDAEVLEGKKFTSTAGLDHTGTMKNHGDHTNYMTADSSNDGNLHIRIDPGAYVQKSNGTNYPVILMPLSELGDAADSDVISGKRFTSTAGLHHTGTIPDCGQYQYAVEHDGSTCGYTKNDQGEEYFYVHIPEGCYKSNGAAWAPEARITHSDANKHGIYNDNDIEAAKAQPKTATHKISLHVSPGGNGELAEIQIRVDDDSNIIWYTSIRSGEYNSEWHDFTITN